MSSQATGKSRRPRQRGAARAALVGAAAAEFNDVGFVGTDTNRIARRAGYAPQTFYRHFPDKLAIFIEVYRSWVEEELGEVGDAAAKGPLAMARVLIEHHTLYRGFRRSLRQLSVSDDAVRQARADSRRRQMRALSAGAYDNLDRGAQIALLLCIERIADAAADGELTDLGLSASAQAKLLARAVARLSLP